MRYQLSKRECLGAGKAQATQYGLPDRITAAFFCAGPAPDTFCPPMPTLDWLNRATSFTTAAQVPYRLLDTVSTHGDPQSAASNLLIQGDNLEALKALLPFYRGQVKCIFIDPPYNTQSAFEHYDDNLEHSQWLSMMLPRLQLLRDLLSDDGSIWVTIDDNEGHYLKVLMDEVFGRRNFVTSFQWQKTLTRHNDAKVVSEAHDCYMHAMPTK